MASSGDDSVVRVYQVMDALSGTDDEVHCLHGHGHIANVFGLAFDRAGKQLLSCGRDGSARCYDLERMSATGGLESEGYRGHFGAVHSAEWIDVVSAHARDGRQFVTASDDATMCLWDTRARRRWDGEAWPVERLG